MGPPRTNSKDLFYRQTVSIIAHENRPRPSTKQCDKHGHLCRRLMASHCQRPIVLPHVTDKCHDVEESKYNIICNTFFRRRCIARIRVTSTKLRNSMLSSKEYDSCKPGSFQDGK
ncbi:hypothetical protein L596_023047 [Steinernema carpocapsae]|uniref:Uncharacterized protein n=1 Tax=Steinernema carpocapsae TaxID=34508 RepID=A0A4U5MCF5_STECR|nr:hypothetical protein L596_023047 [Steinernema carpocapsae]